MNVVVSDASNGSNLFRIDISVFCFSFISKNILTISYMTSAIEIRTIKVSDKGQVSIPKDIRKNMKIKKGDSLVMMVRGSKIVLEKSEKIALVLDSEFKDIETFTEHSLKGVWDNPYDEVWNKDAPPSTNTSISRRKQKN